MQKARLVLLSVLLAASTFAVAANGVDTWLPESLLPSRTRHQDASEEYADVRAGTSAPIAEWREAEVEEAKAMHRRGGR